MPYVRRRCIEHGTFFRRSLPPLAEDRTLGPRCSDSGLLECPCTDRITVGLGGSSTCQLHGGCQFAVKDADECRNLAGLLPLPLQLPLLDDYGFPPQVHEASTACLALPVSSAFLAHGAVGPPP